MNVFECTVTGKRQHQCCLGVWVQIMARTCSIQDPVAALSHLENRLPLHGSHAAPSTRQQSHPPHRLALPVSPTPHPPLPIASSSSSSVHFISSQVQADLWVSSLFLCWSSADAVRYLFFAIKELNGSPPYALLWLRSDLPGGWGSRCSHILHQADLVSQVLEWLGVGVSMQSM